MVGLCFFVAFGMGRGSDLTHVQKRKGKTKGLQRDPEKVTPQAP